MEKLTSITSAKARRFGSLSLIPCRSHGKNDSIMQEAWKSLSLFEQSVALGKRTRKEGHIKGWNISVGFPITSHMRERGQPSARIVWRWGKDPASRDGSVSLVLLWGRSTPESEAPQRSSDQF